MKKEKVFRKIVIHSLLGFPIGITLLMISYANVYLIAGETIFKIEIAQLQDIATLVSQLIIVGWAYYLFFILVNVMIHLNENKSASEKFVVKHPYKAILIMLIMLVATALILTLLDFEVFSKNISMLNIISFIIVFVIFGICICIKSTIESNLIKKINQKLKEKSQ